MPSDLQVSNIKDLTGSNTGLSIASDGQVTVTQNNPTLTLGSNATISKSGMVVKVENDYSTTQQAVINDGTYDVLTIDFVRVSSSSHFILVGHVYLAPYNNGENQDSNDPRILLRENNAGAGEATININSHIAGDGFYRSDVPMFRTSLTHNGLYDSHPKPFGIKRSISGSAGDTINFKIRVMGGNTTYSGWGVYTNRSYVTGTSGAHSVLTIMEVIN